MNTSNRRGARRHAYLLDTNIFLEWLLGQDQAEDCEQLLVLIERGELKAFVLSWALHSIEHLLHTRNSAHISWPIFSDASNLLKDLMSGQPRFKMNTRH